MGRTHLPLTELAISNMKSVTPLTQRLHDEGQASWEADGRPLPVGLPAPQTLGRGDTKNVNMRAGSVPLPESTVTYWTPSIS
jgi:hypothetical protein